MEEVKTEDMRIGALAPWFGGKRTMAPLIVTELGKHTQYFEPFCGGMSVLLCKEPSQKETVCDLHGDLVNLARVVQSQTAAEMLYDRLQRALFSEDLLECASDNLENPDSVASLKDVLEKPLDHCFDVDRAFWYFLASWMGRNGTAGTERLDYQIAVRWTKNGGSPTVRFRNAIESMPAWHQRLRNVVILNRDAFQIIDRFEDCPQTAIYADPPYHAITRGEAVKNGRGGRYLHEFTHETGLMQKSDHERLRDALSAYKHARVVVSYYDCPEIRELYRGWTVVEHTMNKQLHAQNGRGARKKEAPEILLINGPSYAELADTQCPGCAAHDGLGPTHRFGCAQRTPL